MTVRPILFSGPMIRAILDGTKSQTRRVIKPNKSGGWPYYLNGRRVGCQYRPSPATTAYTAGDLLWVRETHVFEFSIDGNQPPHSDGRPVLWHYDGDGSTWWEQPHYRATDEAPELALPDLDEAGCRWRPSIYMLRWASRLTLRVTDARVERLQEIGEDDAKAEGAPCCVMDDDGKFYERPEGSGTYRCGFAGLWNSINGGKHGRTWDDDPWVAVISFETIHQNVDAVLAAQREEVPA